MANKTNLKTFLVMAVILLGFGCAIAAGEVLYVDATGGDNGNPGTETEPWQTLAKVNTEMDAGGDITAGDTIYFKRGETFTGKLDVDKSGEAGNVITFGAYGTGDKPILDTTGNSYGIDMISCTGYVDFENLDIRNSASVAFMVYGGTSSNINITDCDCDVDIASPGTGYYFANGTFSDINITNSTITNFTDGFMIETNAVVSNLTINNVTANSGTYGFRSRQATAANFSGVHILNSTFDGNSSAGIYIAAGNDLEIRDTQTSSNTGGSTDGVYIGGNTSNVTIDGLTASLNGRYGLYLNLNGGSGIDILNSHFDSNTSRGISSYGVSDLEITNCTASNTTSGIGVLFSGSASDITIDELTVNSNVGNGLFINTSSASNIIIQDSGFSENGGNGLSVWGAGDNCHITNVETSGNGNDGFNIKNNWTNVIIDSCTSNSNGVTGLAGDGDGYSFHNSCGGTIKNSVARDNKKTAIAHIDNSQCLIENCLFSHTTHGTAALVYLAGISHTLYNSTLYNSDQSGIGLEVRSGTITVENNIINGFDTGFYKSGGTITNDYNLVYGAGSDNWSDISQGAHSISSDPLFIGPDGLDGIPGTADDEDYNVHLRGYSPCINAGDPGGDYSGQVDIDGQPRAAYGRVDMGADEVFPIAGDVEPDGDVDFADFAYFANNWLVGVQ